MELSERVVFAGGKFQPYADTKIGLLTHGLNYGTGCFEGVRGFWVAEDKEVYLLQLADHYTRLKASAKILMMEIPHTTQELCDITIELIVRNRFEGDVYIRPLVYKSAEDIGVRLHDVPCAFAVIAIPFDKYLDASGGLKAGVVSWRRIDDTVAPARGKITGIYINSALAKTEAILNGYDEGIFLSHDGHVAEGSAENIFVIKRNVVYTPDPSQNILEGITRENVIRIARELDFEVVERALDRSELYSADEVFFTGSAAGIAWCNSIDHRPVGDGKLGPVTKAISEFYDRAIRNREPEYRAWLTPAYASRRTAAV